jgi:hypothetical protein
MLAVSWIVFRLLHEKTVAFALPASGFIRLWQVRSSITVKQHAIAAKINDFRFMRTFF